MYLILNAGNVHKDWLLVCIVIPVMLDYLKDSKK